jgi:hypothetical protein
MKLNFTFTQWRQAGRIILAMIFTLSLTACFEEKTDAVSYLAVNHTDQSVMSIIINGEGGILNAPAQGGGGGEMCCVTVPHTWRPGLMVTVKWQGGGEFQRDAKGKVMTNDGVPIVIESPWKQRTVELPKYEGEDAGQVTIHFLPNDEIKVLRSKVGILAPDYPIPYPTHQQAEAACKKYPNTPVCGNL